MLKDNIDSYYFSGNYNCAESITRAANDYYDLKLHNRDMIMVGAYGGGMQTGHTCGAILGACAALSMLFVDQKAHESADIKPVVTLFLEKIEEKAGSLECRSIKPVFFTAEKRCKATVDLIADCLEETIREYRKERD